MTTRPASKGTLASRIALLAVAVAVLTGVLAAALSYGLIRKQDESNARRTLARLADAAQSAASLGPNAENGQQRARRLLETLRVQTIDVNLDGTVSGGSALGRSVITVDDTRQIANGGSLSTHRRAGGTVFLIEGRPTRVGGLILLQGRADALAQSQQALRRLLLASVIGTVFAAVLGLLVAQRIARPLRHTAQAARALAAGQRDVAVVPEGPAEVSDVGQAVNTLAASLAHSEARQREFLMSVSHDLRTPLTTITGYAESLADGVAEPDQAQEIGRILTGEAQRLNRLVSDLLDLARLDAREFRIDRTSVDLTHLAADAARVWTDRCAANDVPFRLETTSGPLVVTTDPARVRQIIDGLLENALRVTPAGRPVVLAIRPEAGQAVLEVRDGGPGLADADLQIAFDRGALYERYRSVRQVGTGLGLAIVASLTQRLGGTCEAGHASEGGARFTVRLPA